MEIPRCLCHRDTTYTTDRVLNLARSSLSVFELLCAGACGRRYPGPQGCRQGTRQQTSLFNSFFQLSFSNPFAPSASAYAAGTADSTTCRRGLSSPIAPNTYVPLLPLTFHHVVLVLRLGRGGESTDLTPNSFTCAAMTEPMSTISRQRWFGSNGTPFTYLF